MERDIEYEKNNIGYDEQFPKEEGGGIKCKNYKLCDTILPKCWYEYKRMYLCINCHMMFGSWTGGDGIKREGKGELDFFDNKECDICYNITLNVSYPNCNHSICINCFKRCFYGDYSNEPEFPYPEIEDEYDDEPDNLKWNNYPLIEKWRIEWNKWEDIRMENLDRDDNLRNCCICRK